MRATKRAFYIRGGAACAAAAILLGGTFAAGAATAAPSPETTPTSVASAAATATATESAMPEGLAEAVERDLGKSVEEFNAEGELAAKAAEVQAEVTKTDPAAVVSIDGDAINVKTSDAEAAETAAGTDNVNVTPVAETPPAAKDITDVDTVVADYAKEFGVAKLQSIMQDANGNIVIRTGDPLTDVAQPSAKSVTAEPQTTTADFAAKYGNVVLEAADGPATALATDVTNGQGYAAQVSPGNFGVCSIGWNGFNKAGDPAVISAGHCTNDGSLTDTVLTVPAQDDAGQPAAPGVELGEDLGTFGFSQFGGPNHTAVTGDVNGDPSLLGNIGTDVSVIDDINPDLNQLAKVTDWTTPATPKNSGPVVTGVSTAVVGANVCKSGRTTGWTCGEVTESGVFFVAGQNHTENTPDVRGVRGFGSTELEANQGDSGGAIIVGTLAVGMVSAGIPGVISYGVGLNDALAHTDGYTIKIALNAPEVTTTAPIFRATQVTGTVANAPAGTTVAVTIDGKTSNVAVGADGTWSVKAPNKFGTFTVTAQARNGFNTSETTTASIEIIKQTLAAPAITAPAQNSTSTTAVTAISGTGKAGATVELTGDVTGSATVGADNTWSFPVSPALEIGSYTVTAQQTLTDWNDSQTVTSTFTVVPAAPAVVSPANGQEFAFDQGPSAISGTNVEGATVVVDVNGTKLDAQVVNGTWSVSLGDKLATGEYSVSVVQTVNNLASSAGTSVFQVLAAPAPPATQAPAPAPAPTTDPAPSEAPAPAPSEDELANTGASSTVLMLGAAGGVLLMGGIAFLLFRRRNSEN